MNRKYIYEKGPIEIGILVIKSDMIFIVSSVALSFFSFFVLFFATSSLRRYDVGLRAGKKCGREGRHKPKMRKKTRKNGRKNLSDPLLTIGYMKYFTQRKKYLFSKPRSRMEVAKIISIFLVKKKYQIFLYNYM